MKCRKIERAITKISSQSATLIGKGDRLYQAVEFLKEADPSLGRITRQRLEGDCVGNVIETKDVMILLSQEKLGCRWGVIPLDKLVEWAWENGYQNFIDLRKDFKLIALGGSECTVEIACDPQRQDLIDAFEAGGIQGLATLLKTNGERIATDTPGIAEYFFGSDLLFRLSGSLEALPKDFSPVIIGVVESGNSLEEEKWLRLAQNYKRAVLLKSQLILVITK